nr:MAG TPA: hypothetical protein [Caudoviricetes sp.]
MIIELTENKEELPFLQNGFDFQKQALRGLFLLNGSATISLLTFFSNVLLKNPQFAKELFKAILFFFNRLFYPGYLFSYPLFKTYLFCKLCKNEF